MKHHRQLSGDSNGCSLFGVFTPSRRYTQAMAAQITVRAKWAQTENNRRAKYYSLTPRGQKRLKEETALWAEFSEIVNLILASS